MLCFPLAAGHSDYPSKRRPPMPELPYAMDDTLLSDLAPHDSPNFHSDYEDDEEEGQGDRAMSRMQLQPRLVDAQPDFSVDDRIEFSFFE